MVAEDPDHEDREGRREAMNRLTAKVFPSPSHCPSLQNPAATQEDIPRDLRAQVVTPTLEVKEGDGAKGCCAGCAWGALCRAVWGVTLGGCAAISWAGGMHAAKATLQRLPTPFFITCFCCTWNLFFFPLYYLGHLVGAEQRRGPVTCFRQHSRSLGEEGMMLPMLLRTAVPFSTLWSLSSYLYLLALRRISASDTSAVLCCSQAFSFLLSWIGLKDTFVGIKIVGAILSITGIVMMAYADGFHGDSITGVALGVGSAFTSALYKVLLRKHVGDVHPGAVSVLFSYMGLCAGCIHLWFCLLLHLAHVERWPPSLVVPWDSLCVLASLLLSFNVTVHFGNALAYPILLTLGVLMSIPASTAADIYLAALSQLSQVRVVAASTIGAGYLLLLFPERWDEVALQWLGGLWHRR